MSDDARDAARYRHLRRNVSADMERAASAARSRLEEAESLLRELTDIEGPQPGHVMWARKVWAFLGVPPPAAPRTISHEPDCGWRDGDCTCLADESYREGFQAVIRIARAALSAAASPKE